MTENEQMQAQIERDIEQSKAAIKRAELLERLEKNKDFRELILDDYCEKEVLRLNGLRHDTNYLTLAGAGLDGINFQRNEIDQRMESVARLQQFFDKVRIMGAGGEHGLAEKYETLEELRLEGALDDES